MELIIFTLVGIVIISILTFYIVHSLSYLKPEYENKKIKYLFNIGSPKEHEFVDGKWYYWKKIKFITTLVWLIFVLFFIIYSLKESVKE